MEKEYKQFDFAKTAKLPASFYVSDAFPSSFE